MTMTRSAAVSRRAIEPGPGPGLRTAAHSCAPAQPPAASGQVAPPPLLQSLVTWMADACVIAVSLIGLRLSSFVYHGFTYDDVPLNNWRRT